MRGHENEPQTKADREAEDYQLVVCWYCTPNLEDIVTAIVEALLSNT